MKIFGLEVLRQNSYAVHFGPKGGCETELVNAIKAAKLEVRAQVYHFDSTPVRDALVGAFMRGVNVQIILDNNHVRPDVSKICRELQSVGVTTLIDMRHRTHSNVFIVDKTVVLTGGFGPTVQAESENAENLLTLRMPILVSAYMQNWISHAGHSVPANVVPPLSTMEKFSYVRCSP